jgi:hypothetical protein
MVNRDRHVLPRSVASIVRHILAITTSVLLVVPADVSAAALSKEQPTSCGIAQPLPAISDRIRPALGQAHPQPQLTPEQIADRLDKLFSIVAEADRRIPRDTFDPQAVIDKTGKDPNKIFEWVRDQTYFVPYRGLLKGEKGVLMDRLGNSLDRALLLYNLLQFVNQPARLAHGTLTQAQAKDVLAKVRPVPSFEQRIGSSWSPTITSTLAKQYAEQNNLESPEIRKELEKVAAQQQRTEAQVKARVVAQAAAIAEAVGHPPASVAAKERAEQLEAITDHWWVQWQNGGTWTDLDPTLPVSLPGQKLTAMQGTVAPKKNYTEVGEKLVHNVQIQVVIEVWRQGKVKEIPVLTQQLVPASLIGVPIVLLQIPLHWPQDLNPFQEKAPVATFKKTALAQTEWLPVLSVGTHKVSKYSFNDYGDLNDSTLPGYVQNVMTGRALAHGEEQGVGDLGSAVAGILGSHQIGAAPQQANQPLQRAQVTAEWVDYTIQTPGKPARTIRREIFDLIGPAARETIAAVPAPEMTVAQKLERALSLMDTVEILPLAAQPSPQFILHSAYDSLLSNQGPFMHIIRSVGTADYKTSMGEIGKMMSVPSLQLYSLVLARSKWNGNQTHVYLDESNILTYHRRPVLSSEGHLVLEEGFDIVSNDVAVIPNTMQDPFRLRLEQGVLDTNVEAALAGSEPNIANTANAFAEASVHGPKWLALRDPKASALRKADLPKDARVRLLKDMNNGHTIIVPPRFGQLRACPTTCWWRINSRTGTTLGIGDRGWGQTATEKVLLSSSWGIFAGVFTYESCTNWTSSSKRACLVCAATSGLAVGLAIFSLLAIGPATITVFYRALLVGNYSMVVDTMPWWKSALAGLAAVNSLMAAFGCPVFKRYLK